MLWDTVTFIDEEAKQKIRELGGIQAIAVSHPHFYTTMVDWAREFECPVYLAEADREWVMRKDDHLSFWSGASLPPPAHH